MIFLTTSDSQPMLGDGCSLRDWTVKLAQKTQQVADVRYEVLFVSSRQLEKV